jgi:deoxyribonuclease (pyrimidine dimer)
MTRINLVPPSELADQHLFAEFREMKMVPKSLRRSLVAARRVTSAPEAYVLRHVPATYVLGKGHVSFFYDKRDYMQMRYSDICRELDLRGVEYNRNSLLDPDRTWDQLPPIFHKNYDPTPEALVLIRERIRERIAKQPEWYKFHGAACFGATGMVSAVSQSHV